MTAARDGRTAPAERFFWPALSGLTLVALTWRLVVLASPLGELDGDEAVVGLMARHIAYLGDRPVFYYNQPYLGSLEAFSAAALFVLFGGSSSLLLKLVPTLFSLGFVALTGVLARRLFGAAPALAATAYLAVPPAMLAVWSTKARGGYAELLCLGAALLLATLWLAERFRSRGVALTWGLLAGLSVWTHLLSVVYLLPAGVYLLAWRRRAWSGAEIGFIVLGALVGAAPLLVHNAASGLPTLVALLQPADLPLDPSAQLVRFFRVGLPVLLGLGQPTTSTVMFDADWGHRPAGRWPIALLAVGLLAGAVAAHAPAVRRLLARGEWPRKPSRSSFGRSFDRLRRASGRTGLPVGPFVVSLSNHDSRDQGRGAPVHGLRDLGARPALLVLLALTVPPVIAATRFGFFVSEPRYALPLYSIAPLAFAVLWRLRWPLARWLSLAALLALNLYSVLSTEVRLWRPEEALESTPATRAALVARLVSEDRHQMYADYWVAYPVMFETREAVLGYVISGGFNRYFPHADNVQRTPNPAWVFMPGSEAEIEFLQQLGLLHGSARVETVSVYRVYTDVQPLEALRPPR